MQSFLYAPQKLDTLRSEGTSPALSEQKQKILDYVNKHGAISDAEVQNLLGLKKTRAFTLISQMREAGLLRTEGRGATKRYRKV